MSQPQFVLANRSASCHMQSKKLRAVHVSFSLNVGGMEKLLTEFARHLDREAFDQHFVSLERGGQVADELESAGQKVSSLDKRPGLRPATLVRLAKLLRRLQPDIVHTHNTAAFFYAVPAARLARVPAVVHTRHGQRNLATKRQNRAFRFLSRFVDCMVCVSEDGRRLSIKEGIDPRKTRTIWNGIDLARFSYSGPTPNGPAIIVARLVPEKDVETLVRATAIVAQERPDFRLNIVGDGACKPSLEELAAQLGLSDCIRFLGEMHSIAELLARASVFILPSLTEGISLTLLEAMATGVPVVATNVGGNPEVVVDGETGLLVQPGSPALLANAMARVLSEPELARQMGVAGRRRVEEHFDVCRMLREYEALYVSCCGNGHSRSHSPAGSHP
jgi:sugar transferase (PEP-CTERM/EpsH1 system associated)